MNYKNLLASAAVVALAATANADLLMTEIVDATLTGGQPKFVELTNTGAVSVDLSLYSLGNFNNGGTTLGGGASTALTGSLAAGASYIICYEPDPGGAGLSAYFMAYGTECDFYMGGGFVNGDDVIALFFGVGTGDGTDATMVDVYGELGIDGTGTAWENTDSYSYRCGDVANAGVFAIGDWFVAGADFLETGCAGDDVCELAALLAQTTPGVHVGCGAPSIGVPFCYGDGSDTACPCGNVGAAGEGCTNSSGAGAILTATGSENLAAGDLGLTGAQLPASVPALFFSGVNTIAPGASFGDGLRCAGGAITRLQVAFTDASGDVSTSPANIGAAVGATVGSTSTMQIWFRDVSAGAPCGSGFNTSSALLITWN